MPSTTLRLHTGFIISQVDPRIFGGFLEHMGRAVYEGVFDPDSAHADADGFRTDVLHALRQLDMPVMRYPGGNFVSGYHWEDGVGPVDERPTVRELAWQSIEPNTFGTDEFMNMSSQMGWTPMVAVNLGTGTPEEARNWLEYCNAAPGTTYADKRVANGHPPPYGVPLWCLGNEMDGRWQLGHVPAEQYAIRAQQAAKMMKDVDRSIELVVCGTSIPESPTYLQWDREVLEYVGGLADYLSLHRYVDNWDDDTEDFLAVTNAIDRQILEADAVCRYVAGKRRSSRRAMLCFDEWNVWYKNRSDADMDGAGKFAPHLVEEVYNLEDALVVAGFFNSFLRHADVVKIANMAQIVNVLGPLQTRGDELLVQSIFHVFRMYSARKKGTSLQVATEGPTYEGRTNGVAPVIDASAIIDANQLHVFVTNRSLEGPMDIEIHLADRDLVAALDCEIVSGADPKAANSFADQTVVAARPFDQIAVAPGRASLTVPALAAGAFSFELS